MFPSFDIDEGTKSRAIMSNTKRRILHSESYKMARALNLHQIEIFKAVIEHGTVSRAAEVMRISQPAASKLLVNLEEDTGLALFDRFKGRLVPTPVALRLYEEVSRIFVGMRQVDSAVATIKRENQARLVVGAIPALSGIFVQRATTRFLEHNPDVYCSFQSLSSQWIVEYVLTRKLDVGLVSARIDNPYVVAEPLLEQPLVCIIPMGHPLARRAVIRPADLKGIPFVSFSDTSYTGQKTASLLERHKIDVKIVLTADVSPTVCQFVAAGLGVSLVHPLFVAGAHEHLVIRPFEPSTAFGFLLCYARDARNAALIANFVEDTKAAAALLMEELKRKWL